MYQMFQDPWRHLHNQSTVGDEKKTAQPRSCPTATIQNPQAANDKDLALTALAKTAIRLSMVWGKA